MKRSSRRALKSDATIHRGFGLENVIGTCTQIQLLVDVIYCSREQERHKLCSVRTRTKL